MKRTEFNCVAMKRKGAELVLAQTARMSKEQELEFWEQQSKRLRDRQEALRQRRAIASEEILSYSTDGPCPH
jgi:hypothetical protein